MQLLLHTHIYQEGSISPPCMVLFQSVRPEESACVLLVNGEAMCSQERLQGDKSKPLSPWGTTVAPCSLIKFVLKRKISFAIPKDCNTTCQAEHEKNGQITVTAEESHKSPRLSFCIFKAE